MTKTAIANGKGVNGFEMQDEKKVQDRCMMSLGPHINISYPSFHFLTFVILDTLLY